MEKGKDTRGKNIEMPVSIAPLQWCTLQHREACPREVCIHEQSAASSGLAAPLGLHTHNISLRCNVSPFLPIRWLTNCTTTQRKTAAGLVKRIADRELLEALLNMWTFHNSLISLLFVFLVCVQQEQPVKVMLLLCRSAAALQFHRQS